MDEQNPWLYSRTDENSARQFNPPNIGFYTVVSDDRNREDETEPIMELLNRIENSDGLLDIETLTEELNLNQAEDQEPLSEEEPSLFERLADMFEQRGATVDLQEYPDLQRDLYLDEMRAFNDQLQQNSRDSDQSPSLASLSPLPSPSSRSSSDLEPSIPRPDSPTESNYNGNSRPGKKEEGFEPISNDGRQVHDDDGPMVQNIREHFLQEWLRKC